MLTLYRKEGEYLLLTLDDGQVITIRLDSIKGKRARISIGAPDEVKIMREEIPD